MGQPVLLQRRAGHREYHHDRTVRHSDAKLRQLHNHVALGYVHASGEDLEIDGTLTLVNG